MQRESAAASYGCPKRGGQAPRRRIARREKSRRRLVNKAAADVYDAAAIVPAAYTAGRWPSHTKGRRRLLALRSKEPLRRRRELRPAISEVLGDRDAAIPPGAKRFGGVLSEERSPCRRFAFAASRQDGSGAHKWALLGVTSFASSGWNRILGRRVRVPPLTMFALAAGVAIIGHSIKDHIVYPFPDPC
ncbi:hypothetical protein HPB50_023461 [Hyalomma asiaticum]|uniref:Uncharacterized protein n=1 Tax=Hyalomma asiaticum TaxID=266040 RepID=A0ACB7TMU2_HYAAI|nr:hypothetical protein HPB50_023461 [Hyalomma asiaticum]